MTKDMTTGPITPLLVNFTIPLVLGNLFQLTYNAVDSIIVGKFVGEDALAAVGTSNPLKLLVIADQHAAVNTFPGLVHTARHTMGVCNTRSP